MAFVKYARAQVITPAITKDNWTNIREAAVSPESSFEVRKASEVVLGKYDPSKYVLSHCTIVASVDTESPKGKPLGKHLVDGMQIDRRYPDFYVTTGTTKLINNNCFVPGTLVTMADGTVRKIEEVQVGDEVLTHLGRARKVIRLYESQFSGDLLVIKTHGTGERIRVTPEHPFYVYRHNQVSNRELLAKKAPEFTAAKLLSNRDFMTAPVLTDQVEVNLTMGQARLLGLFLAEGYYGLYALKDNEKVKPVWAFHKDECGTLARTVIDLLESEFGVSGKIHHHSYNNGIHVDTPVDRKLVEFFSYWVRGKGSKTKTLHPDLLRAPEAIQMEIVRGWLEGDGSFIVTDHDARVSGCTASRGLASQLQLILFRLGVSNYLVTAKSQGRKRIVNQDGSVAIVSDPDKICESWQVSIGAGWANELVQHTVYEKPYGQYLTDNEGVQSVPKLRFLNGYHTRKINRISSEAYEGSVYNLEVEEDNSYLANGFAVHNCDAFERGLLLSSFRTFVGGQSYVEHVQIPELSKGRIIDAAARDIGESVYIDILVANDRKHRALVAAIQSGQLNTLSMGCQVAFTICTKCGNVAEDETQLCTHIRFEKGQFFIDASGQRRKVAELCGHISAEPGSVKFIEASWVANPAFKGAVLRNVLDPKSAELVENRYRLQAALQMPVEVVDPSLTSKVARIQARAIPGDHLVSQYQGPSLGYLRTPPANVTADRAAQVRDDRLRALADGDKVLAFDNGMSQGGPAKENPQSRLEEQADKLYESLVERVTQKVKEDLAKPERVVPDVSDNDTLIRSALKSAEWRSRARVVFAKIKDNPTAKNVFSAIIRYSRGGWSDVQKGNYTGREILIADQLMRRIQKRASVAGESRVYQVASALGGTRQYPDLDAYLDACRVVMGRSLTETEKVLLVKKGKLFSMGV